MSITPQYDREGMADMIRIEFRRQKENSSKRKYKPNTRYDNSTSWLAAADNCILLGADPIGFVEACFNGCSQPGGPFANQLGGPGAQGWWRAAHPKNSSTDAQDSEPEIHLDMRSLTEFETVAAVKMLIRITKSIDPTDWFDLLYDYSTSIDDHVRLALGHWMPGITERYGERGMRMISKNPAVLETFKKLGFDLTDFVKNYGRKS
jgi:hypothetical protein